MIKGLPLARVFSFFLSHGFEGRGKAFQVMFAHQKLNGLLEKKAGSSNQAKGGAAQ